MVKIKTRNNEFVRFVKRHIATIDYLSDQHNMVRRIDLEKGVKGFSWIVFQELLNEKVVMYRHGRYKLNQYSKLGCAFKRLNEAFLSFQEKKLNKKVI